MCEQTTDSVDDASYAFARQATRLCYDHYKTRLSKNGKPQKNCEWTLLAAVVQSLHSEEGISNVSQFVILFIHCSRLEYTNGCSIPRAGLCSHPYGGIFTPWKQLYPPDQAQCTSRQEYQMCTAAKTNETYLNRYLFVINQYKIVSSCGNLVY